MLIMRLSYFAKNGSLYLHLLNGAHRYELMFELRAEPGIEI